MSISLHCTHEVAVLIPDNCAECLFWRSFPWVKNVKKWEEITTEKNAQKTFENLIEPELQFSLDVDAELHYNWFLFKFDLPTLPVPYQAQTVALSTEKNSYSVSFPHPGLANWAFKKGH